MFDSQVVDAVRTLASSNELPAQRASISGINWARNPIISPLRFRAIVQPANCSSSNDLIAARKVVSETGRLNPTSIAGRAFGWSASTTRETNTSHWLFSLPTRMASRIKASTSDSLATENSMSKEDSRVPPYNPSVSMTRAETSSSFCRIESSILTRASSCTLGSNVSFVCHVVSPAVQRSNSNLSASESKLDFFLPSPSVQPRRLQRSFSPTHMTAWRSAGFMPRRRAASPIAR